MIYATGHKSSGWIVDRRLLSELKAQNTKDVQSARKFLKQLRSLHFQISISKASVTLSTSTYAYDGKAKTPVVTVKVNGKTLKNGTDYTVSYSEQLPKVRNS